MDLEELERILKRRDVEGLDEWLAALDADSYVMISTSLLKMPQPLAAKCVALHPSLQQREP
jgi:hypothetical protein